MEEIRELRILILHGTFIRLNWDWPLQCQEAYLTCIIGDAFIADPARKVVKNVIISKKEYEMSGNYYDIPAGESDFDLSISALHRWPSPQNQTGARRYVWRKNLIEISYFFQKSGWGGSEVHIHFGTVGWHPHLLLGYKSHTPPQDELEAEWTETIPPSTKRAHNEVCQLNGNNAIPPGTYGQLFVADPVYAHCVKFNHPSRERAKVGD